MDLTKIIKAYDVRGLVPQELSPWVAFAIGQAFGRVVVWPDAKAEVPNNRNRIKPRAEVVIGHDMRESGPELAGHFAAALMYQGIDVIQIGLCSTDGLYYAAASRGIPGAMFTASHNPAEYNGIKMCRAGAKPVGEATGLKEIRELAQYDVDHPHTICDPPSGNETEHNDLPDYARFLRSLVDLSSIRPLRVVIDAGNGMGGYTAPAVLGTAAGLPALPLELIPLYWELDGSFPNHEANPLDPANLVDLQVAVIEHNADIGLAFDGDADRCFVVDETGNPVSPSVISALVGLRELARAQAAGDSQPTLIYNLISSRAVPEQFEANGAKAVRTRVGHSFIKAQMANHGSVFGGEHSGHYYFKDFWFADSGMLAAMHVLAALGSQNHTLSKLAAQYDPYVQSGEINSKVSDVVAVRDKVVAAIKAERPEVTVDDLDGVTVSHWPDDEGAAGGSIANNGSIANKWWFNLRGSNTEPLLRLNVEATDQNTMELVRDKVLELIANFSGE